MKIEFLKPNENIETLVLGVASDGKVDAPHLPKVLGPVVDRAIADRREVFTGHVGDSLLLVVDPASGVQRVLLIGVEGAEGAGGLALLGRHAMRGLIEQKISVAHIGWHSIRTALNFVGDATHEASHFAVGAVAEAGKFSKYFAQSSGVSFVSLDFLDCATMDAEHIRSVQVS